MLEKIRQATHHYLFKLFFLLIAIAFVIGIRDFSQSPTHVVATIGSQKASLQDFLQTKQEVISQFSNQELLPKQINNIAVVRLTTQSLLAQEAANLGISVSPETLAEYIRNDTSFHKNGEFDLEVYKKLLENNNLSEDKLLKNLSNQVASKFLIESLIINMPLKKILNDFLYDYIVEKRAISLLSVDTSRLTFSSFIEADLQNYYQKNRNLFQSDEKRSFSYMLLSLSAFEKNATISDVELYKHYEQNMAEYALPETRDFYHFLAPNQELALKVVAALNTNQNVAEVAKKLVEQKIISENFTNQPSTSFIANLDPSLFQLKEDGVTAPIKSDLGWHIFKVTKIHPKQYKSFDEAKLEANKKLRRQIAEEQIYELTKQIEDDVASGTDFKDIARRHNLEVSQVKQASGNDAITTIAFQTELNEESDITPINDNQDYVIVRVDEIFPTKILDYAEASDKVKNLYSLQLKGEVAAEMTKALQAYYQKNGQALINNSSLNNAVAQSILQPIYGKYKIPSESITITLTPQEIVRSILTNNPNLSSTFVDELFNLKTGKASIVHPINAAKYAFAIVTKIITDYKKDPQLYKYVESIGDANYKNEIYDQYLDYLRNKYPVKINYELINSKLE